MESMEESAPNTVLSKLIVEGVPLYDSDSGDEIAIDDETSRPRTRAPTIEEVMLDPDFI